MDIRLVRAAEADAEELLGIQRECFRAEYEKYRDENSPYLLPLERMRFKIAYADGVYYKIVLGNAAVGGLWVYRKGPGLYRLSILYVLPEHQSKGIGQRAIALAEALQPDAGRWELDCPEDLPANRRCYERAGYHFTGERHAVSDRLTLVDYRK